MQVLLKCVSLLWAAFAITVALLSVVPLAALFGAAGLVAVAAGCVALPFLALVKAVQAVIGGVE